MLRQVPVGGFWDVFFDLFSYLFRASFFIRFLIGFRRFRGGFREGFGTLRGGFGSVLFADRNVYRLSIDFNVISKGCVLKKPRKTNGFSMFFNISIRAARGKKASEKH